MSKFSSVCLLFSLCFALSACQSSVLNTFFKRHPKIFNISSKAVSQSECLDLFKDTIGTQNNDAWKLYYSAECGKQYPQYLYTAAFQGVDQANKYLDNIPLFAEVISKLYLPVSDVPYHNAVHGADLAQRLIYYLTNNEEQFAKALNLKNYEMLAMLISASAHDIGHPGNNNYYENLDSTCFMKKYYDAMEVPYKVSTGNGNFTTIIKLKEGALLEGWTADMIIAVLVGSQNIQKFQEYFSTGFSLDWFASYCGGSNPNFYAVNKNKMLAAFNNIMKDNKNGFLKRFDDGTFVLGEKVFDFLRIVRGGILQTDMNHHDVFLYYQSVFSQPFVNNGTLYDKFYKHMFSTNQTKNFFSVWKNFSELPVQAENPHEYQIVKNVVERDYLLYMLVHSADIGTMNYDKASYLKWTSKLSTEWALYYCILKQDPRTPASLNSLASSNQDYYINVMMKPLFRAWSNMFPNVTCFQTILDNFVANGAGELANGLPTANIVNTFFVNTRSYLSPEIYLTPNASCKSDGLFQIASEYDFSTGLTPDYVFQA